MYNLKIIISQNVSCKKLVGHESWLKLNPDRKSSSQNGPNAHAEIAHAENAHAEFAHAENAHAEIAHAENAHRRTRMPRSKAPVILDFVGHFYLSLFDVLT